MSSVIDMCKDSIVTFKLVRVVLVSMLKIRVHLRGSEMVQIFKLSNALLLITKLFVEDARDDNP